MKGTSEEESRPTRVSGRIKAARRHQQLVEDRRDNVSSSASASSSNKAPEETENAPVVKISSSKKNKKPDVAKNDLASPRKEPPRSPPKSPRSPVKKGPNPLLPCRKPPYPLYSPKEKPSFEKGIESLVHILRSCRNIAVLTGAGISVSCGIPDFRSEGVGLYSVLDCGSLGLSCPEELFDWEFFQNNPSPFFQFAKKLYFPLENNQKVQPSDSHKLLRLLQDRKQLLRVYSQNIDGLEEEAGVLSKKVVYAHGSLKWATCLTCKRKFSAGDLEQSILEGAIPYCQVIPPTRPSKAQSKQAANGSLSYDSNSTNDNDAVPSVPTIRREPSSRNRKRPRPPGNEEENSVRTSDRLSRSSSTGSSTSSSKSNVCGGILKPNVTFFGQVLPDNVSRCLEADRKKVDALIVIGTSLSVAPISKVIGYLPANIPRILINRTIVHPRCHGPDKDDQNGENSDEEAQVPDFRDDYVFDAYLMGNCDDVTRALVKQLRSDDPSSDAPPKPLNDLVEMGRLLSEVREDSHNGNEEEVKETLYHAEEWDTATVPAERVFLFPGAQPPTPSMEEAPVKLQEVCHCNACAKRILRGHIHKCLQCFDYDLCSTCFPKVSRNHYDGLHQFGIEKVQVVPGRR